ncbi:unnamed protein product [Effrenium voratum]|nr:unnamed protein product [Effrenium voratum]
MIEDLHDIAQKCSRTSMHTPWKCALISATDPVATIALFGSSRFRTDPLLHSLINGESVLNDAVAIVLFSTLTHHLHEEEPRLISASILGHFGLVLVGSVLVGVAAGAMLSWCFCTCKDLTRFPDYEIAGMFLGAYLTFALTQLISLSGITALFCFGVVLAHYNWYNLSEQSKVASKVIFGTMAKLAEAGVFVYLGVVAALSIGRFHWHAGCVIFALIAITVARAAHVFPLSTLLNSCRRSRKITNNMSVVMWVSGLRGAIAFALSLRVPCEGQVPINSDGVIGKAFVSLHGLEVEEEEADTDVVKTILCWIGAWPRKSVKGFLEFPFTKATCHDKKILLQQDAEERCVSLAALWYLKFIEGICRCCTAIVLVDITWAIIFAGDRSYKRPPGLEDLRRTYLASGLTWFITLVTLYVGFASAGLRPSFWVAMYAHICDFFCHTVITTAIIGIVYECIRSCGLVLLEFAGASHLQGMVLGYCCCQVHVESEGLEGGLVLGSAHNRPQTDEPQAQGH